MHRTDGSNHLSNMFSNGDPIVPRPGTQLEQDWLNDVQENLCQFIEAAGITLSKGNYAQLTAAVAAYVAAHNAVTNPHSATSAATASRLTLRDASGRAQFADPAGAQDAVTVAYLGPRTRAACAFSTDGTFASLGNVSNVARTSLGYYTITLAGPVTGTVVALASVQGGGGVYVGFATTQHVNDTTYVVRTYNSAGAAADFGCFFAVLGP